MGNKFPGKDMAEANLCQQRGESRIHWLERVARWWYKKRMAKQNLGLVLQGEE